jgi:hypothetical protein
VREVALAFLRDKGPMICEACGVELAPVPKAPERSAVRAESEEIRELRSRVLILETAGRRLLAAVDDVRARGLKPEGAWEPTEFEREALLGFSDRWAVLPSVLVGQLRDALRAFCEQADKMRAFPDIYSPFVGALVLARTALRELERRREILDGETEA